MKKTKLIILAPTLVAMAGAIATPASARASSQQSCTFEKLTRAQQREYGAAYQRRTHEDGQVAADRWLRQRACPAQTRQNNAKWRPASSCKKTKVKNVLKPGYGGGMTLTPTLVCAD